MCDICTNSYIVHIDVNLLCFYFYNIISYRMYSVHIHHGCIVCTAVLGRLCICMYIMYIFNVICFKIAILTI